MTIHEKLTAIQSELHVPKGQTNKFGGYKYRSCEDILEALKPLLKEHGLVLTISDDIVERGARVYVKATATVADAEQTIGVHAYAREAADKKGMDDAQITGAASSYARKYALNGLFAIDDTKDSDATNDHAPKPITQDMIDKPKPTTTKVMEALNNCKSVDAVDVVWGNALKYQWSELEKKDLENCKENVLARLSPSSND